MSEWISVKDRLPEADTPVLVTYLGYMDGIARTDGIGIIRWGVWYWYESEDDDNDDEIIVRITHWQPLPEPPEKEEKELLEQQNTHSAYTAPLRVLWEANRGGRAVFTRDRRI